VPAARRALHGRGEVNLVLKLAAYVQTLLGRYNREEGQTMAEYAVILTVITALVLAALLLLGTNITSVINRIADVIG
jgi:Flp pilus assembly pilin Flp